MYPSITPFPRLRVNTNAFSHFAEFLSPFKTSELLLHSGIDFIQSRN